MLSLTAKFILTAVGSFIFGAKVGMEVAEDARREEYYIKETTTPSGGIRSERISKAEYEEMVRYYRYNRRIKSVPRHGRYSSYRRDI